MVWHPTDAEMKEQMQKQTGTDPHPLELSHFWAFAVLELQTDTESGPDLSTQ